MSRVGENVPPTPLTTSTLHALSLSLSTPHHTGSTYANYVDEKIKVKKIRRRKDKKTKRQKDKKTKRQKTKRQKYIKTKRQNLKAKKTTSKGQKYKNMKK
jgi:hypothetical protein